MRLQYLFKDLDEKRKKKLFDFEYKYDVVANKGENKGEVTRTINAKRFDTEIDDHCFVMEYIINTNDRKEEARHLSNVNKEIRQFGGMILKNEASEYFNKELFPLINTFELRLRMFLYLAFVPNDDPSLADKIKRLHEKDFHEIHEILLTNVQFNCDLYRLFSDKQVKYTKDEIIEKINNINNPPLLWDHVIKDRLPTIKESFPQLQKYRNDVMHAHYLEYEAFSSATKLYKQANVELEEECNKMYRGVRTIPIDSQTIAILNHILDEYGDTPLSDLDKSIENGKLWWNNLDEESKTAIVNEIIMPCKKE